MLKHRKEIAEIILRKLSSQREELKKDFCDPDRLINSFYLDDLLDGNLAKSIYDAFPSKKEMVEKKSIREHKYIAAQMDKYNPLLEEVIYAFQDNRIVSLIEEITNLRELEPDENLYAGGISLMGHENFLNPHLDNSHDLDRKRYRVLNLLYYVTPSWKLENGGNLELWDNGIKHSPRVIESKFNRLVVMITHKKSLHSVGKVVVDQDRCCVSNYYFSKIPVENQEYFHVTTFYGRPEESTLKKATLDIDGKARNLIRKVFKKGIVENKHKYEK